MRKVLKSLVSLLVIATMLLSMASVSFASNAETPGEIILSTDGIKEVTYVVYDEEGNPSESSTFTGVVVTANAVVPEGEYYAGWEEGIVSYDSSLFEFVGMELLEYVDDMGSTHEWTLSYSADNASIGKVGVAVGIGNEVKENWTFPYNETGEEIGMVNLYFKVKDDVVADGQEAPFAAEGNLLYWDYDQEDWEDPSVVGSMSTTVTGTTVTFPEAAPAEYTITYIVDGEAYETQTYVAGATIVAPEAPEKEGFTFDGWDGLPATMPESNIEVTAIFTEVVVSETSGMCGTNAKWSFDTETGVLTISGSGAMDDYGSSAAKPWSDYISSIKSVVVEDGITNLGNYAFRDFKALETVTLASTVTKIGSGAVRGCTSLKELTMPLVSEVGSYAFAGCDADVFVKVNATGTKEQFDNMTFASGNELLLRADWTVTDSTGEVILYSSMHYDVRWVYDLEAKKLDVVNSPFKTATVNLMGFGGGHEKADWYPYMGTVEEIEITAVNNLLAFRSSDSVKTIRINEGTETIYANGCSYNPALEVIYLPSTIKNINTKAFYLGSDNSLKKVVVNNNMNTYDAQVTVGSNNAVFSNTDVQFNDYYRAYHSSKIFGELELATNTLTVAEKGTKGIMTNFKQANLPEYWRDTLPTVTTSVIVDGSVKSIGTYAFYNFDNVTSVTIKPGVEAITGYAFADMNGLTSIVIPSTVKSVGSYAFKNDTNLTTMTIASPDITFEAVALSGCLGTLKTINFTGTEAEWEAVKSRTSSTTLKVFTQATVNCNYVLE